MLIRVLLALACLTYPLLVWLCLRCNAPQAAACVIFVVALATACLKRSLPAYVCAATGALLATLSWTLQTDQAVKFYPVFVNAAFFTGFALSLTGTSAIERFARLREPHLDAHAVRYCRRATVAWCLFFVVNGTLALDSALWRSTDWWALYNGAISYVLIGAMFAAEWCVRHIVRSRLAS